MNIKLGKFLAILFFMSNQAYATQFNLPADNQSLIGEIIYKNINRNETSATISLNYDIGFNTLQSANPQFDLNRNFFASAELKISTMHLLPDLPHKGIVVNLPEMRMYYYPAGKKLVYTYPIGIGKIGKNIPITKTIITRKITNPTWYPTPAIREYNLTQGIVLPQVMPAGPDNPLGPYAIYTGIPTYLIHSTIFPESIGRRASFGCIRMYESDIEEFFPAMEKGITVSIINSPVKVGWQDERLFMETYPELEEHQNEPLPEAINLISHQLENKTALINWEAVSYIATKKDGIPHEVGIQIES